MATFVVAHGAWSAAWAWKKVRPLLAAAGHAVFTPTYTGLGERAHLAHPAIDLETHVEDVLGLLEYEDLRDVVLVAHSYGGMVGTAVADRARDRVARLVYLDAFVPRDGESLGDLVPADLRQHMRDAAASTGDGWRVPPHPVPADTPPADVAWITPRRRPQPIRCFDTPLRLRHGELTLPRAYIYCLRRPPEDVFGRFAARARRDGWPYHELDASHSPNVTAPEALAKLLVDIAAA
jgi:pimeloyl-ACP methyl ester carboxylesterase